MHSSYVRQILSNWATQNKVIPQDWKDPVVAVAILKARSQLRGLTWWRERERAAAKGQCNQTRVLSIVKDQLLGEGQYLNLQSQMQVDIAATVQCHLVALRAWGKVKEPGKISISFTKTTQIAEVYTVFFSFCKD